MDEKQSMTLALGLLKALSASDVEEIIGAKAARYWFENPQHWHPYGGRPKNWDTVGNQQTNPVGALVELVTNGIDSVLLRKARESGIKDFRSPKAPQSMTQAVKTFFPNIVEGKISNLETAERADLAKQCMQIGVKRADRTNSRYPTYTVVDFGDGQKPENFIGTFLSLSEKNKEGIPFVQGKFNMGSTGSLRFCTRSDIRLGHYKLIISRPPKTDYWGWTLLRVRGPRDNEALPVAEYFAPFGHILRFEKDKISAFGHESIGLVTEGSIVRLYEFDVGGQAYQVDLGLYDALTVSLIDCALPIQLYDFDAKPVEGKGMLRKQGIAERTFGGLSIVLRAAMSDEEDTDKENEQPSKPTGNKSTATEWVHHVLDEKHEELGHIRITATAVHKLKEFLHKQSARIFYTVNGQTHAFERASFLNTRVGLGDIRNHILVNVICDGMDRRALAAIFMPDRERKANVDLARILEDMLIDALKGDGKLREYAAEIRRRRATDFVDNTEETKDFLSELVKVDPAIKDLFGLGTFLPTLAPKPSNDAPFSGKQFPTFLDPLNLRKDKGLFVKDLPLDGYRRIECGTDAANDYLSRVDSPGEPWSSLPATTMPHSVSLRNGTASFTVKAPKNAKVGDSVKAEFGFQDMGRNVSPLKFSVLIRFVKAEEKKKVEPGDKRDPKKTEAQNIGMPKFEWVGEADWSEHDFDQDSGAYVNTGDQTVVYVNRDNRFLRQIRLKRTDEAALILDENMFRFGLGILALSIHKKASGQDGVEAERIVRTATDAMSAHIVTVIRRLGGVEAR
jgi:hypothetical protein